MSHELLVSINLFIGNIFILAIFSHLVKPNLVNLLSCIDKPLAHFFNGLFVCALFYYPFRIRFEHSLLFHPKKIVCILLDFYAW
jgi:hypothetical protein